MYPVTIETFPGVILATLPHRGSYQEIGPVFDRLFMLAQSRGLAGPDVSGFGIYYDDPDQVPTAELRSRAGLPVAADAALGEGLERFEIPAGRCAVLAFTGPYNEMEAAYNWMFSKWLPTSGVELADFPMFEEYLNDPHTTPAAQLKTRIYMPLV